MGKITIGRDCVGSLGAGIKNGRLKRMRRMERMLGQLPTANCNDELRTATKKRSLGQTATATTSALWGSATSSLSPRSLEQLVVA